MPRAFSLLPRDHALEPLLERLQLAARADAVQLSHGCFVSLIGVSWVGAFWARSRRIGDELARQHLAVARERGDALEVIDDLGRDRLRALDVACELAVAASRA